MAKKRRRKKYRLKKWVKKTLFAIFILIILVIVIKVLVSKYLNNHHDDKVITDISVLRKQYDNTDIVARIMIDNIKLDAIVTKTTNNDYYLEHDIYKNKSLTGNPFIDYRNSSDIAHDKQVNIYSHNVENKEYSDYYPFSKLERLLDKDIFNKNNEIFIYTDNRILKYQIYAIKIITEKENEHMRIKTNSIDEWDQHLDRLLANTKYCLDDCKLDSNDDLLILQTCYYDPEETYMIVIAKKV